MVGNRYLTSNIRVLLNFLLNIIEKITHNNYDKNLNFFAKGLLQESQDMKVIHKQSNPFLKRMKFFFDKDYRASFSPDCSKLPCSAESRSKKYKERFGILLQNKLKQSHDPLK